MPSVYLETTIPSYLTAWPSPEVIMAARQQITREWWDARRNDYQLFISQLVIEEASSGDASAAARRLEVLEGIISLEFGDDANALSKLLIRELSLPARAESDAVHIALAVVNGMDYLLTWNCTHIANAALRPRIEEACRFFGYHARDLHTRRTSVCVPMKPDPILAEIRATREAYSERFQGDVDAMIADLRKRQAESGRKSIRLPPKRLTPEELAAPLYRPIAAT